MVVPADRDPRQKDGTVQVGRLSIGGLSSRDAAEFYTYQFLVRARPAAVPDFGMTSIVIVTHNQLEYTRQCLDSIIRLTDEPYELIVVDNGSTDGTVEYLRGVPGVRRDYQRHESRVPRRGQPGDGGARAEGRSCSSTTTSS